MSDEIVGQIPVRQDIIVLPADDPNKKKWSDYKEGDVEYETYGDYTVKYIYTKDDDLLEQTNKLIREEELKIVDRSVHIHDLKTSRKARCYKFYETLSCQDKKGNSTWFVLAKDKDYFYACHDGVMMLSFPEQYNSPCAETIQYRGKTLEDLFDKLIKAGYTNLRTRINPHVTKPYQIDDKNAWAGIRSALDNRTHLIHKQAMINLCKQHEQPLVLYRRVWVPLVIYEELGTCIINDYCLRDKGFYEKLKYKFDDFKRNIKHKIKDFNYKKRNWMCRNLP